MDALEAVLGAIYLDGGMEAARRFVLDQVVTPELAHLASNGSGLPLTDYKSSLQEKLQAAGRPQPMYLLVKEQGPEHSKMFTVEARLSATDEAGKPGFCRTGTGFYQEKSGTGGGAAATRVLGDLPLSSVERPTQKKGRL